MASITINITDQSKHRTAERLLREALNRELKILRSGLAKTQENLKHFEKLYKMSSEKFFRNYQNGQLDDRNDFIDWAGEYHLYQSLREQMEVLKEIKD